MASGTATMAPSTAPMPLAGPGTMEPIVPIRPQLGAQDTPSVIQGAQDTPSVNQGARPAISTEQTMQSIQRYGTLEYVSGPPYTAPLPSTAPLPYAAMPAMLARPSYPMVIMVRAISSLLCLILIGCPRGSQCCNISSFRNGSSLKLGELAKPSLSLSPPLFLRFFQLRLRTMLRSFQ